MSNYSVWLAVVYFLFAGCRAHQPAPETSGIPPSNTHEACTQIHNYFIKQHGAPKPAEDMSRGCEFRVTSQNYLTGKLTRHLEAAGWTRQAEAGKTVNPSEFIWEVPSTRCSIEEVRIPGRVRGSVGLSGGTGRSSGFGFGLGIGSGYGGEPIDYRVLCQPKTS